MLMACVYLGAVMPDHQKIRWGGNYAHLNFTRYREFKDS